VPELTLGQHVWAVARELVVVVVGAVVVASLLRALVGQMFLIPSASMENTLLIEDRVVVEKISSVKRGQVVVFADPGDWLLGSPLQQRGRVGRALEFVGVLPDTATEHLVKRVIGMPGDHVVCCDTRRRITVNDKPLDETGYLFVEPGGARVDPSDIAFDVVVPRKRVFVLGDNRADSRDSRCHLNDVRAGTLKGENAFVSEDLIVGRAVAVVWPLGGAKRLRAPLTLTAVPAATTPAPATPVIDAGPEAAC
jgi:signal peptidase I